MVQDASDASRFKTPIEIVLELDASLSPHCQIVILLTQCSYALWYSTIYNYVKDGRPGMVRLLHSFFHNHLHTYIRRNVDEFTI